MAAIFQLLAETRDEAAPGESYRPLYSLDQTALNNLCRELFPMEYFKY